MRSPVHPVQPCSVASIEPDGIMKTFARNVWIRIVSTRAITSRIGSSFQNDRFLAGFARRRREPPRSSERDSLGFGSSARSGSSSAEFWDTGSATLSGYRLPCCRSVSGDRLAALLDLRRLAAQIAQVVQLRAADVAALEDLDLRDVRRVDREGALDADAEGDLPDGERLADAAVLAADHHALEDLVALAVAFVDADVHLERVAGAEARD